MPSDTMTGAVGITETAPAKINLALHVTGQRADGYHLLETLVTFADTGDVLHFSRASSNTFSISGRFSPALLTDSDQNDNLVLRARDLLRSSLETQGVFCFPVAIHLEKNLPIASGIGGGSADAAATLRGLLRLWNAALPEAILNELALQLGADVPMCLKGAPLIARGIGEEITPVTTLPGFALVLANPLQSVSTPQIFTRLENKVNAPLPTNSGVFSLATWMNYLGSTRNDLETPARAFLPEIGEISAMLRDEGAVLVRMSGSGATCFGIFSSMDAANQAEKAMRNKRPEWYFQATMTQSGAK